MQLQRKRRGDGSGMIKRNEKKAGLCRPGRAKAVGVLEARGYISIPLYRKVLFENQPLPVSQLSLQ